MQILNFKSYLNEDNSFINLSDLINQLHEKINISQLYSGNCGTFAQALGSFIPNVELVVVSNVDNEEDLFYGDPDIYHIFLLKNNKYFDGIKLYSSSQEAIKMLETTIATDSSVGNWSDIIFSYPEWNSTQFDRFVRNNTNYSISKEQFQSIINSIVQGETININ